MTLNGYMNCKQQKLGFTNDHLNWYKDTKTVEMMVQPYKLSHLEQIQSSVFVSKKTGPPESTKFRFVGSNRWFGYFMIFPICRHSMQEQAHINQYRYMERFDVRWWVELEEPLQHSFSGIVNWRNSERSCYCHEQQKVLLLWCVVAECLPAPYQKWIEMIWDWRLKNTFWYIRDSYPMQHRKRWVFWAVRSFSGWYMFSKYTD